MTSTTVAIEAVDVILRDGTTLRLRPPGEADRKPLVEFFEGLDSRSLYLRFHGHPTVDERLVEPVLEPDWIERGALLGSVAAAGEDPRNDRSRPSGDRLHTHRGGPNPSEAA